MIPVFAIVGRPNVGKSTLFNRLTKSQNALVVDVPGVTRDRIYGEGKGGDKPYILIDTGGLAGQESGLEILMAQQTRTAISESDAVFFMVDAKGGLIAGDFELAKELREQGKTVYLLANKVDGSDQNIVCPEFYRLGLGEPIPIAAAHNRGIAAFISEVLAKYDAPEELDLTNNDTIRIAIIGRPNVGKSTLVNRLLDEERVVVFDEAGTTRDTIAIDMERNGQQYTLVDTAGIRRRGRITDVVEKFSVVKTLRAVEEAHVIIFMVDAVNGISDQDLSLIGFVLNAGRAMVLAVNKWDSMEKDMRESVKTDLARRLDFMSFVERRFISARHGAGVDLLFKDVNKAFESATKKLPTPLLTKLLQEAVQAHSPPIVKGRRIKLRYAHMGGNMPPRIVIHGNQTESVTDTYRRYLINHFRTKCKLVGTPLLIEFKSGENPFEGIKNVLTDRQVKKRRRLKTFVKKSKQKKKNKH